jgi:hypothetical protein
VTRNTHIHYQKEVHEALEKCQFVEETLRIYINLAVEIAKLEMANHFLVRFTTADLSKLSLGKLVRVFSRLSNDASLKSSLKNLTSERNFVAHRSLLFTLGELQDSDHIAQSVQKMRDIKERASKAHEALLEETWSLRRSLSALKRGHKSATLQR